jgi:copper ion binding protein
MFTVTFSIPNISCNHCVHTIQTELSELPGVKEVKADAAAKIAVVSFEAPATQEQIIETLKSINYAPVVAA